MTWSSSFKQFSAVSWAWNRMGRFDARTIILGFLGLCPWLVPTTLRFRTYTVLPLFQYKTIFFFSIWTQFHQFWSCYPHVWCGLLDHCLGHLQCRHLLRPQMSEPDGSDTLDLQCGLLPKSLSLSPNREAGSGSLGIVMSHYYILNPATTSLTPPFFFQTDRKSTRLNSSHAD